MEVSETYYRLKCDNCGKSLSPMAESKAEACDLAKHIGWVIYKDHAWCIECFYKLTTDQRMRMINEISRGEA